MSNAFAAGMVVGIILMTILFSECVLPRYPDRDPKRCEPFVSVAAFKDGDRAVQVCRTLDGGLEMKP